MPNTLRDVLIAFEVGRQIKKDLEDTRRRVVLLTTVIFCFQAPKVEEGWRYRSESRFRFSAEVLKWRAPAYDEEGGLNHTDFARYTRLFDEESLGNNVDEALRELHRGLDPDDTKYTSISSGPDLIFRLLDDLSDTFYTKYICFLHGLDIAYDYALGAYLDWKHVVETDLRYFASAEIVEHFSVQFAVAGELMRQGIFKYMIMVVCIMGNLQALNENILDGLEVDEIEARDSGNFELGQDISSRTMRYIEQNTARLRDSLEVSGDIHRWRTVIDDWRLL